MNVFIIYLLLLIASSISYIFFINYIGKNSIIRKIAFTILPSLMCLAYTSFSFALTWNYYLFIPALAALFVTFYLLINMIKAPLNAIEQVFKKMSEESWTLPKFRNSRVIIMNSERLLITWMKWCQ